MCFLVYPSCLPLFIFLYLQLYSPFFNLATQGLSLFP